MNPIFIFLGGVVAIVLLVSSIAFFSATKTEEPAPLAPETTASTSEASSTTSKKPTYTIEAVPYTLEDVMPSLDYKVVFSASVPASVRPALSAKIEGFQKSLKEDPMRADDWYDLALWYHSANDFQAAKEVWEFLTRVVPNDTTAYDNLGKLHHFDLKDFPKAEEYFTRSITLNPDSPVPYLELHTLYRYSYKQNTTLAVDILETAAKHFPSEVDPLTLLGVYWKEKGDTAKAREAYLRAMERARAAGGGTLIQSIGEELAQLPQ